MSRARGAQFALVGVGIIAYVVLGMLVSHAPPRGIDVAARALAGHGIGPAEIFTKSCLYYVFAPFCIVALLFGFMRDAWRTRALFSVVLLVGGWLISDQLKNVFVRPRPEYWYFVRESSYAYSSGHAMFAVTVYGLWAYFVWKSSLPSRVRYVLSPLLLAWSLGIVWSRLALGAHYPSDLLGGIILGLTLVTLGLAIAAPTRERATAG